MPQHPPVEGEHHVMCTNISAPLATDCDIGRATSRINLAAMCTVPLDDTAGSAIST